MRSNKKFVSSFYFICHLLVRHNTYVVVKLMM